MKKIALEIRDLSIGHKGTPLYTDITFDIYEGDCILLCGANGSGKTTLLKSLAELKRDTEIVMIPTRIPKVKGFTLREFIHLSCNRYSHADPEHGMSLLSISSLADRDISTLSDGEFQKGTIAAALARHAGIILLDEPTAFLDAENRRIVLKTLREICEETSVSVIFSSHDLHESISVCNKVLALGADGIFRCSENDLEATISSIFTKH